MGERDGRPQNLSISCRSAKDKADGPAPPEGTPPPAPATVWPCASALVRVASVSAPPRQLHPTAPSPIILPRGRPPAPQPPPIITRTGKGPPMKIYLAAPLFTTAERRFNRRLAAELARRLPHVEVLLPQDFRVGKQTSFNDRRHARALYARCMEAIEEADAVLAVLDGPDADSGVCFEAGYARALGKRVVGLRTDFRQLQVRGLNIVLAEGCHDVLCHFSFNEDMGDLADALLPHLEKGTPKGRSEAAQHAAP